MRFPLQLHSPVAMISNVFRITDNNRGVFIEAATGGVW